MATTLTITSPTYAGEAAKGYLAAALLEGNTIAKGGIAVSYTHLRAHGPY